MKRILKYNEIQFTDRAKAKMKINLKDRPITIIGLGLIGGSLANAFKREGFKIIGVSSVKTLKKAGELNIIDQAFQYDELGKAVENSAFVFICTPLNDIARILPDVMASAGRKTIVTDVGSTKKFICQKAAESASKGAHFIGGHPMAGSEKRGLEHSNPYLFYDAVWVLTPTEDVSRRDVKRLSELIGLLGAKVMVINPELHDRIAANVSHLPQLLAVLLTGQLADKNDDLYRNLAAGGFRDMTRIASSDFKIWRDIIQTNREEILSALTEFKGRLNALIENIDNLDFIERSFEIASEERKVIPRYSKGFLTPLIDVRVSVKDRPGELAKITNIIYYQGVNIKDIEIVNIREGEGGILRLGFSEKRDANIAAQALKKFGYNLIISG